MRRLRSISRGDCSDGRSRDPQINSTPTPIIPYFIEALEPSDPDRQITTLDRDTFGKPLAITRSGNYTETQSPPLANINESLSSTRQFVYDAHQRLCKRIDQESGASVLAYDASNNLEWSADGLDLPALNCVFNTTNVPPNTRVTRGYDDLNRLTSIDYPDSADDVVMTYHADGALDTAAVGTGLSKILRTYLYNNRRQLTSESMQLDGQSFELGYEYNLQGHLTYLSYPDGSRESLIPDAFGRPTQVGPFASYASYHPSGAISGFKYGNQVWFSQTFNTRQLPAERSDFVAATVFQRSVYTYDQNGNLTKDDDQVGDPIQFRSADRTLGYDGLDRLTTADAEPQVRSRSQWGFGWDRGRFTYDPLDNVRRGVLGPLSFSYQYKDKERLSLIKDQSQEPGPDFAYAYNARGQATQRSLRRRYGVTEDFTMSWDSAHRMLTSNNLTTGVNESYRYDAHGHRVRNSQTGAQSSNSTRWQMYSQAGDLMYEKDSVTGKVNKYFYLAGRMVGELINGEYHALHTDNVGTLRMKTGQFNTVIMEDMRAPYGSVLLGWNYHNGPAFAGHVEDMSSGLTYMKARYYDSTAMRFLSPDPVDVSGANGGNFNRYWYANNNPYKFTDPDGRQPFCNGSRICPGGSGGGAKFGWSVDGMASGGGRLPIRRPGLPIPIPGPEVFGKAGEALNAILDEAAKTEEQRTYVTYSLTGPNGKKYFGRASGFGTPDQVMMKRYATHEWRLVGYGSPQLDKSAQGVAGRFAIRGREQQLIDYHGGVGSAVVANIIRGVAAANFNGPAYHAASTAEFGEIARYTGWSW